ncbi:MULTISPECIES: hypothetical protein [Clostridia]|nr:MULTISPECIES: hypothetical protein [Clostridia]
MKKTFASLNSMEALFSITYAKGKHYNGCTLLNVIMFCTIQQMYKLYKM